MGGAMPLPPCLGAHAHTANSTWGTPLLVLRLLFLGLRWMLLQVLLLLQLLVHALLQLLQLLQLLLLLVVEGEQ